MSKAAGVCAMLGLLASIAHASGDGEPASLAGRPADVASSAYAYRADRPADANPPEAALLLMQYADQPFTRRFDPSAGPAAPALRKVLCGLLWEEVRPIRRVELAWAAGSKRPAPEEVSLSYFDATDGTAHTWWNPRTIQDPGKPELSADGLTYRFTIPVDTWGVVAAVRGAASATDFAVPTLHAFVDDVWKMLDVEIEWGFGDATAALDYDGSLELYDAVVGDAAPLAEDRGTTMVGPRSWRSTAKGVGATDGRRGVHLRAAYVGTSRWRRVWPYLAQPEDVARSIVTLRTNHGSFSFLVSDLERGPILAPEFGFFVRAVAPSGAESKSTKSDPPALQLLPDRMETIPGIPRVRGWANGLLPWFGANADTEAGAAGSLVVPARSVAMHPLPDRDVVVQWMSPLHGSIRVTGKVAMADASGGNGVAWSLVRLARARGGASRRLLARGTLDTGGSATFPDAADALAVDVDVGDVLALVVDAREGNHYCDTTVVEWDLAEVGGERRDWNLTHDVVDSILAGNPHADSQGKPDVWRFGSAPIDEPPPIDLSSTATSARAFVQELAARKLSTIRERVRDHAEPTWEEAVAAMQGPAELPPFPTPPFEPAMQIDVPSPQFMAQWKLGAWHILRHSVKDAAGKWHFNDFPFGILASETASILRALDLLGMHQEAADGLDQWLQLPNSPRVVPGANGHHALALPDRPLGHFSDGDGCLTHAEGPEGWGGNMDGVHAMGPGAIAFAIAEHFRLTGDLDWLKRNIARFAANAEWIVRQRHFLDGAIPGGRGLWSAGLQPAQVVTPDSMSMHMQFYETEAYYWLAVARTAELLALVDPAAGAKLAAEAEAYRRDLLAAVDLSITRTPVVAVRDGTYHSFIPFAPYVRGFAAGAWGWRRCQGHVGAIYWDTVQSADPLVSPSGLLSPLDPRVQGHLDVLEDRLLLENTKVESRTPRFDADRDYFEHASWQYQCGLERHANIHLEADDTACFLRSLFNQYAVDLMPGEYTFREHTNAGPPDKIYEESCFLERFRGMLLSEAGDTLWLARATPRAWLAPGRHVAIRAAPSSFGPVSYDLVAERDDSPVTHAITATIALPARRTPKSVRLRLRTPTALPIRSVTVDGKPCDDFDRTTETIRLDGRTGTVVVRATY